MAGQRVTIGILVTCVAVVLLLGEWIYRQDREPSYVEPDSLDSLSAPASTQPLVTAPAPTAVIRHRLAGTVVGDVLYAVIENPDGTSKLYALGDTVAGLGRVVSVSSDRATVEGPTGQVELRLAPAPTVSTTPQFEGD